MAKAIRFHKTGGPEVLELETVEVGAPGPGQARVRHSYVAVNFIDIYFRTGRYPHPLPAASAATPSASSRPWAKASTDVKPGDRVGYLLGPQGAYARRARDAGRRADPAARRRVRPHRVDADDEGHDGAVPVPSGATRCKGGETILYHAAAGGVGLVACQWARALGVTMIGTVSTDEKAAVAKAHGCTHTIVTGGMTRRGHDARDPKRVREITGGKGVPVVYDSVGKDTLMASLDSLQPRGTLVSNGTTSGPVVIDTTLLAVKGSIWVTRPAMMHYAMPRSHMLAMADELFGHVLAGRITGEPKQQFALADAAAAHRALESRRTTGATVLVP